MQFVFFVTLHFWHEVAWLFANPITARSNGGIKFETLAKNAIRTAYEIVHTDFSSFDNGGDLCSSLADGDAALVTAVKAKAGIVP